MKKVLQTLAIVFLSVNLIFAQEKPAVKIGGALRYNFNYSSWKDQQQTKFGYDMLAFSPQVSYRGGGNSMLSTAYMPKSMALVS